MPFGNFVENIKEASQPYDKDLDEFIYNLLLDLVEATQNPILNGGKTKIEPHKNSNLGFLNIKSQIQALVTFSHNENGQNTNLQSSFGVSNSWQRDYQIYLTMIYNFNNIDLHKTATWSIINNLTQNNNNDLPYKTTVSSGKIYGSNLALNEFKNLVYENEPSSPQQPNYITSTFNIIFKIKKI